MGHLARHRTASLLLFAPPREWHSGWLCPLLKNHSLLRDSQTAHAKSCLEPCVCFAPKIPLPCHLLGNNRWNARTPPPQIAKLCRFLSDFLGKEKEGKPSKSPNSVRHSSSGNILFPRLCRVDLGWFSYVALANFRKIAGEFLSEFFQRILPANFRA